MVVLALLGLLTTVLAVGASRLLAGRGQLPEDIFWQAVTEARTYALNHQCEVRLSFDNTDRVFRAVTPLGARTFPVPATPVFELAFLGTSKGGNSILVGGVLIETTELESVRFFEDGTCTPFRAQLRTEGSTPVVLEIDPWTCAPVLRAEARR